MRQKENQASKALPAFTFIEILLVVAMLVILATIVVFAINPSKQLSNTKNSQRQMDVKTLVDSINQYELDNGSIPAGIDTTLRMLGTSTSGCNVSCTITLPSGVTSTPTTANACIDIKPTMAPKYLVDIPFDPLMGNSGNTYYAVMKTAGNRIAAFACGAELGQVIGASR
jgi:type II secretory pathway pseudopilin PulG